MNVKALGAEFVGTLFTGAYAFGHVSGGHFNPAVTVGLVVGRRFDPKDTIGYIVAQVLGG